MLAAAAPQAAYPLSRLGLALGEPEGSGWPTTSRGIEPCAPAVCLPRNDNRGPGHATPKATSRVGLVRYGASPGPLRTCVHNNHQNCPQSTISPTGRGGRPTIQTNQSECSGYAGSTLAHKGLRRARRIVVHGKPESQ
jgi:hypothetical protein